MAKEEDGLTGGIHCDILLTNFGTVTATDITLYLSYTDVGHIELETGVVTCSYAAEPGKSLPTSGYCHDKDVQYTALTAYDYVSGDAKYHVDLLNKSATQWSAEKGNIDFDTANILTFSFDPQEADRDLGWYQYITTVNNNSDVNIKGVVAEVVLLDSNNNALTTTKDYIGSTSGGIRAHSKKEDSQYTVMDVSDLSKVSKLGVAKYTYFTTEPDENGYNMFVVDLIRMTATGSLDE